MNPSDSKFIPVSEPSIGKLEEQKVLECVRSGWISSEGPFLREFEEKCAASVGKKHGIAVSSATAGLQVAMRCLDLKPGDEVILPTFTIISCATAVIEAGAKPVLVDCDPETWTMDVDQTLSKISAKTRAIMPVHIYGHPVDLDPILEAAKKKNIFIVEDNAEGHGAFYKKKPCGSFGDLGVFSFYANKLVTTGEGGMIVTSNDRMAERARGFRNLCFLPEQRFLHREVGHNYRMTNLQGALGLAQLQRLSEHVELRRVMAKKYNDGLKGLPLQLPVEKDWARNIYWMYGIVLNDSVNMDAKKLAEILLKKGVQTRPFFLGMHEQPVFHERGLFKGEKYPVAENIARRGLYLPSGQALTSEQITRVIDAVRSALV